MGIAPVIVFGEGWKPGGRSNISTAGRVSMKENKLVKNISTGLWFAVG
jgi:hypothetical protein